MEQEPILNEHNKQEYPLMHTVGTNTPTMILGLLFVFFVTTIIIFSGCASLRKKAKNDGFCPTIQYEGRIVDSEGKSSNITISLMTLLDSSIIGSYYYDTLPSVTYSLGGKVNRDNTFEIGELRNGSLSHVWKGTRTDGRKAVEGVRTDISSKKEYGFKADIVFGKSYWEYIRKKESYDSYTNLQKALRHKNKVFRVDFESQGLTYLPDEMAELYKVESINLLGNKLDTFPSVLAQLKNVFYLSLCSNKMKYIGPEIGELTNLRVLIINMNQLRSLPKEIGNLANLMYLDVGENPIDSLPEEIKNLTKLQVLHIDNWQPSSERFSDEYKRHLQELLPNCRIHFDKNDHIK